MTFHDRPTSLEDLAFPPLAADILKVTAGTIRATSESGKINIHARNLLALDLGTHTGFALRRRDGTIIHDTESFTPRASWTAGQRWLRYRSWLSALIDREQIHAVTFERVVFGHSSTSASDVYGGFRALTEMVADSHNCELSSVSVPTIKKHFTGSGRADKAAMIAEAKRRGFRPDGPDAADALAILDWAISREEE